MKRSFATLVVLLAAALPLATLGDDAPNTYSDPAMSFTAPAAFTRIKMDQHDPEKFEQPAVMAAFVRDGNTQNGVVITLRMDQFQGDYQAWATSEDNDLRSNTDGVFIKSEPTHLSNGMPAMWEEVTVGSGFDIVKSFRLLWSDGIRGVELSESGRENALDEPRAKKDLAVVSAVAYPVNRY